MGNRGRFGKYGDIKRVEKLRAGRMRPFPFSGPRQSRSAERVVPQSGLRRTRYVELRPGNQRDTEFVRWLSELAFGRYGDYGGVITHWLESGVGETVIAVWRDRPAGFAMIGKTADSASAEARFELLAIAVKESLRRKGIGSRLLEEIISTAQSRGARELVLHTGTDNIAAIKLFQKAGFEVVGLRKAFYPRGQDAIVMRKVL